MNQPMRRLLYLAIGFGVTCAGLYLLEIQTKDDLLARTGGSMRALAAEVASSDAGSKVQTCGIDQPEIHPFGELMSAITLAEQHGTTQFERAFEAVMVSGFDLLGQQPPDYSLGPGQIRPSTVIKALSALKPTDEAWQIGHSTVARRLLDPCWNHRFGVVVIRWIAAEHHIDEMRLGRPEIRAIAISYNGDGSATSVEGWVASEVYAELVYHLYFQLRFHSLSHN